MKNILAVKEIVFNSRGQIVLKNVFLLHNNNFFSRVLKLKKDKAVTNKLYR